jgi:ABC-2 type transport system ATP-binding protein
MDEAENCDRIAIIDHGKVQALDTPAALKRMVGGDKIIVVGDPGLQKDLAERYGVPVQEVDGALHFHVTAGAEFVPRVVVDFKERIKSIQVKQPSLDDVFLKLTGRAIRDEDADPNAQLRQLAQRFRGGRR